MKDGITLRSIERKNLLIISGYHDWWVVKQQLDKTIAELTTVSFVRVVGGAVDLSVTPEFPLDARAHITLPFRSAANC